MVDEGKDAERNAANTDYGMHGHARSTTLLAVSNKYSVTETVMSIRFPSALVAFGGDVLIGIE